MVEVCTVWRKHIGSLGGLACRHQAEEGTQKSYPCPRDPRGRRVCGNRSAPGQGRLGRLQLPSRLEGQNHPAVDLFLWLLSHRKLGTAGTGEKDSSSTLQEWPVSTASGCLSPMQPSSWFWMKAADSRSAGRGHSRQHRSNSWHRNWCAGSCAETSAGRGVQPAAELLPQMRPREAVPTATGAGDAEGWTKVCRLRKPASLEQEWRGSGAWEEARSARLLEVTRVSVPC